MVGNPDNHVQCTSLLMPSTCMSLQLKASWLILVQWIRLNLEPKWRQMLTCSKARRLSGPLSWNPAKKKPSREISGGREGGGGKGKKNVEFLFHSKTKVYKQLLNFHQAPFLSCYLISATKKHYSRKCFNLIFTFRCRSATFLNYQMTLFRAIFSREREGVKE